METNGFNELWLIIERGNRSLKKLLPARYIEFVRSQADPAILADPDQAVLPEAKDLSEGARLLLASLFITYWSKSESERRQYALQFFQNEQVSAGEEPSDMTEEKYQAFLADFDEWNELFGPIPFWSKSRGWKPAECYEIVSETDQPDLKAGEIGLKKVYIGPEGRKEIQKEAQQWQLLAEVKETETLDWHNNDKDSWSYTTEVPDFYHQAAVVKEGHFFGALVHVVSSSGMGMSSYREEEYGLLCIDGNSYGTTSEFEFRSSDESSHEKEIRYVLRRKKDS